MTSLPYRDAAFDIVICLWTAFYELIEPAEQEVALREMHRVLARPGIGIIEGPTYTEPTVAEIASGARSGQEHRIAAAIIGGFRNVMFAHDPASLEGIADRAGVTDHEVHIRDWGGRERQLLTFGRR